MRNRPLQFLKIFGPTTCSFIVKSLIWFQEIEKLDFSEIEPVISL